MSDLKVGYPYWVEWHDAQTHSGWMEVANLSKPAHVVSVGLVMADEPDFIVLAMSFSEAEDDGDDEVNGHVAIPKGWIKSIDPLYIDED